MQRRAQQARLRACSILPLDLVLAPSALHAQNENACGKSGALVHAPDSTPLLRLADYLSAEPH